MVSEELSEGITQVLDILEHMDKVYIDKIPKKFREFLEKNKSKSYISNLNHSQEINEMNLKEKTKDILAIIYMNYWCSPQQKSDYISLLNENERKKEEEKREKYNPNNIFKDISKQKENKEDTIEDNVSMTKYKESIFNRIINKIKNFLYHQKII